MKTLDPPQTFKKQGQQLRLAYPLALLCAVAFTYSLGSVACHELITLKHTALLSLSEGGWAKIAGMRMGLTVLGWKWIGWHGFGCNDFFAYLTARAEAARDAGTEAEEFDPTKLRQHMTDFGYHLWLALAPKLTKVFNCKNRIKSSEFVNTGCAEIAQLGGRSALLVPRAFLARCLQIYVLPPEITTAKTLRHKYLIIFPLGQDALGGPQLIAVVFFLPEAAKNLWRAPPRGVPILGLVAAALRSMNLPFAGVNVRDLHDVLRVALGAPAYSDVNCEASGVLSGIMDLTSCLELYDSADFDVARVGGSYRVTIRGVDIGPNGDVQYAEHYPSEQINAGLVNTDVKSYLLFCHADGALPKDREKVQGASLFNCVDSLQNINALAAVLYANRLPAMPKAPPTFVGPTFEERIDKFFLELPYWHKKHPNFEEDGERIMRMYKSTVRGILHLSSDACARIWLETLEDDKKATMTWWWQQGRTLAEIKTLVQPFWKNPNAKPPAPLKPMPKGLLDDGLGDLDDEAIVAPN